jgi:hypothetical protein
MVGNPPEQEMAPVSIASAIDRSSSFLSQSALSMLSTAAVRRSAGDRTGDAAALLVSDFTDVSPVPPPHCGVTADRRWGRRWRTA